MLDDVAIYPGRVDEMLMPNFLPIILVRCQDGWRLRFIQSAPRRRPALPPCGAGRDRDHSRRPSAVAG
jgi:hypothetical protein